MKLSRECKVDGGASCRLVPVPGADGVIALELDAGRAGRTGWEVRSARGRSAGR